MVFIAHQIERVHANIADCLASAKKVTGKSYDLDKNALVDAINKMPFFILGGTSLNNYWFKMRDDLLKSTATYLWTNQKEMDQLRIFLERGKWRDFLKTLRYLAYRSVENVRYKYFLDDVSPEEVAALKDTLEKTESGQEVLAFWRIHDVPAAFYKIPSKKYWRLDCAGFYLPKDGHIEVFASDIFYIAFVEHVCGIIAHELRHAWQYYDPDVVALRTELLR